MSDRGGVLDYAGYSYRSGENTPRKRFQSDNALGRDWAKLLSVSLGVSVRTSRGVGLHARRSIRAPLQCRL